MPTSALGTLSVTLERIAEGVEQERAFRDVCVRLAAHVPVYWLGYEDLHLASPNVYARILNDVEAFLGLSPRANATREALSGKVKRHPTDLRPLLKNIDEVRRSAWAAMRRHAT